MLKRVCFRSASLVSLLAPFIAAGNIHAQSSATTPPPDRARAQMEARARVADSLHVEEASHLRARLRDGDFHIGDRIIVAYDGGGLQRNDTLLVQAGQLLRLGEPMGDLSLQGMLRSEAADSISKRVRRYFKNVVIHVTPLLRVAIDGAVRNPGFYYVRPDMPLSDFIMRSGGQDASSDMSNIKVRRGQETLWSAGDVRTALRDGVTLDGLNLDPGDEVVVGERETSAWPKVLQFGLPLASAFLVQLLIRR